MHCRHRRITKRKMIGERSVAQRIVTRIAIDIQLLQNIAYSNVFSFVLWVMNSAHVGPSFKTQIKRTIQ